MPTLGGGLRISVRRLMFEFIFQKNCPILKAFGLVLIENEQLISVKKESRKR